MFVIHHQDDDRKYLNKVEREDKTAETNPIVRVYLRVLSETFLTNQKIEGQYQHRVLKEGTCSLECLNNVAIGDTPLDPPRANTWVAKLAKWIAIKTVNNPSHKFMFDGTV